PSSASLLSPRLPLATLKRTGYLVRPPKRPSPCLLPPPHRTPPPPLPQLSRARPAHRRDFSPPEPSDRFLRRRQRLVVAKAAAAPLSLACRGAPQRQSTWPPGRASGSRTPMRPARRSASSVFVEVGNPPTS
ncbi:unnamed protein product, partial [Ectocarpus sp. 8 AP-2014]